MLVIQKATLKKLVEKKLSINAIAKRLGVANKTVKRRLRAYKLKTTTQVRTPRIGEKLGHWVVLSTKENGKPIRANGMLGCKCRCICGTIRNISKYALLSGSSASCGCRFGDSNKSTFRRFGEIGGSYWQQICRRCKPIGREFTVTQAYAWELFLAQNRRCALTGLPLSFTTSGVRGTPGSRGDASLDRIDSSRGYVEGNLQWVHKDINLMKRDHTQEKFIELCRLVVKTANKAGAAFIQSPESSGVGCCPAGSAVRPRKS